nr:tetratricopeptide repeat protein [Paenibacillus xylanexedens]
MENDKYTNDWPHEWIKKIRTRPSRKGTFKKMRQVDLAKRAGVDPRTVQQWENGDRLPSIGSLKQIIQAFWEEGLFLEDAAIEEATMLWNTVKRFSEARSASGREFADFDQTWFNTLMASETVQPEAVKEVSTTPFKAAVRLRNRPSTFVGRQHSREVLTEKLIDHALISIIGPGGIGKTSFATEVASTLTARFSQGIYMFEFGTIHDAHDVYPLLLSTLGLTTQGKMSDEAVIIEAIRHYELLFIFDNCEHIIDTIAEVAEFLLMETPDLRIITTSREPLNITQELVYRLPPLSYPAEEDLSDVHTESEWMSYEAIQLFVERASVLVPHFVPTLSHLKQIGAICRKIEGIPLAIELTVARMNMLSLGQIEERLTQQLTLLTSGKRTAGPRHQTLRSTIDWSYHLLTGKERLLLQRLNVFAGGFTLEAAEAICICEPDLSGQKDTITVEDMLDLLSGLVNKSLVSTGIDSHHGSIRYSLLEAIKEYATDKWNEQSDDEKCSTLSMRHMEYYKGYLIQAEACFRTIERERSIESVRTEYANLSAALQWCYAHVYSRASGLHLAAHLYGFWLHEGRLKDGLFWLERFLHVEESNDGSATDCAKAWHGLGIIQFVQGNIQSGMDAATRSVELALEQQDNSLSASSLRLLAFIYIRQNDLQKAEAMAQQSVELARSINDSWNLASSLHAYGKIRLEQQRYTEASNLLEESVRLFQMVKDPWELSGPYECLGYAALKRGAINQAVEYFKKCIAASQIYRGSWVLSRGVEGLGITLCARGALMEAALLLGASEKRRQSYGGDNQPSFPEEYLECVEAIHQGLQQHEWQIWWNKGADMSQARVLAYALEL